MRITQSMLTRNYLKSLNNNLSNLAKSNNKLTSGRKFTRMSENVSDGSRALKIREQLYKNEQHLINIRDAEAELSSAESNLLSMNDILQKVQEKVIAGLSDTSSNSKREVLAQEVSSLKEQILQFANAQFADKFLFSGSNNATPPFTADADGKLLYNGRPVDDIYKKDGEYFYDNAGVETPIPQNEDVYIDIGLGIQFSGGKVDPTSAFKVSFSGLDVLGFGKNAEGFPNNLYNLLNDIENALKPPEKEAYDGDKLGSMLNHLKEQNDMLMTNITDIGTRVGFLEKTGERLDSDIANLTELRSNIEAVDDATESMNMKMYEYAWMVTLQFGSKILPQSLMDFLR